MTVENAAFLISSLFVAIPTIRASWRVLQARRNIAAAARKEHSLAKLDTASRQAERLTIERLKDQANDLIEFGTLVPTWAIWCALVGMVLNIVARLYSLFCS